MRNFTLLLIGLLFLSMTSSAQVEVKPKIRCNTFESLEDFRAKHPGAETDAQFEAWLHQKIQERAGQRIQAYYVIPIIFHIVYNGEPIGTGSNLTAADIQNQLDQLNKDFANLSGSTYGVAADIEIQFCLATVDPGGTPLGEAGIDRRNIGTMGWNAPPYDGFPSNSYIDATIMPQSIWDPSKYFNVWTLDLSGGLLGKATFPSGSTIGDLPPVNSADNATHSGVFIHYASVGNTCTPGPFGSGAGLGRTLTHETGHYLGLRHIWGDATCGNDFCNDTPVQRDNTTGCPGPATSQYLQNCPNDGDGTKRMFENYMDYTDDACVNTFTADQKVRMQAVMANSPLRSTLPGAGSCNGPAANAIKFNYTCTSVSETGTGSTCPRFKDVVVNLLVFGAANNSATVTFTKGGTATDGVDYTITPASVSYGNGDNLPKSVTIRIWDDGIVESTETLTLGYTITGSGVTADASNQSFTLTILDDDAVPVINNTGAVTLFSHDFTSGAAGWASGSFIGPAGPNVWTISGNGGAGITGNSAHITNNIATAPLQYTMTATSDAVLITPFINATGASNLTLSFKYKVEGEFDGVTYWDSGRLMYTLDGSSFFFLLDGFGDPYRLVEQGTAATFTIPLPADLNNTSFKIGFRWTNDDADGTNPPLVIEDVVVTAPATSIESTSAQPASENIFAGQDVYLISTADDQLIARIQSPSANLNCITAAITQSGTGLTGITTTGAGGFFSRSTKVISITASPANTTATYTATIYFTTAELVGWPSLTGMKILKVNDGVNLATTITSATGQVVTATVDDQRATKGYAAFTGTFTGGFSQFMLVSPTTTLPVLLTTFEAKPVRRSIVLNWSTSQELNNKGFWIERSTNGANYVRIAWVDGKINSNTRTDYQYTDNFVQPGVIYYYRLRQTDIDGKEKVSVIRQAKINESGILMTINPNPTKDEVKVFISGTSSAVNITLVNMQGQMVRKWNQVNASGAPLPLNISGLASGLYLLEVQLPEEKLVEKLVIK